MTTEIPAVKTSLRKPGFAVPTTAVSAEVLETKKELNKLFNAFPLTWFPQPHLKAHTGVLEIPSNYSLNRAINALASANVLAAPVRKADGKERKDQPRKLLENGQPDWTEDYCGMISMLDIVAFVLKQMKKTAGWGEGFEAVVEAVEAFSNTTVADVLAEDYGQPFLPLTQDSSLLDAMVFLGQYHFQRVVLVDSQRVTNIITQSAMVRVLKELCTQHPLARKHASRSLRELGLCPHRKVLSVHIDAKAIDAFKIIHKFTVSAVPVVDAEGRIIGNISARDIRYMVREPPQFERMWESLKEFMEDVHSERDGPSLETKVPAVCCSETDTAISVLEKFCALGIHRVYVIDDNHRPTDVVSLTDLIAAFVLEPAGVVSSEELATPPAAPTAERVAEDTGLSAKQVQAIMAAGALPAKAPESALATSPRARKSGGATPKS